MAKDGVIFDKGSAERIGAATRRVEATPADLAGPRRGPRMVPGPTIRFGKPATAFSSGTTIILNPCDVDGTDIADLDNITCYVSPDRSSVEIEWKTTDILSFVRFAKADADGVAGLLVGVFPIGPLELPNGGAQYMLLQKDSAVDQDYVLDYARGCP